MMLLSAIDITALHDRSNLAWHALPAATPATPDPLAESAAAATSAAAIDNNPFLTLVATQHLANFRLWHVEDLARIPSAPDAEIAGAKRAIDRINQQRNDLAEEVDVFLLTSLDQHAEPETAPLHSETPGMMIDRLSILSLKLYHTLAEINRAGAPPGHASRNQQRQLLLEVQRRDLASCLDYLWQDVIAGRRRFKSYRQLKMYNDPTLNPSLYNAPAPTADLAPTPASTL